jgi:hypothetical protein
MQDLVVIEDGVILSLVSKPEFTQSIPCLANKAEMLKTSGGGCGSCAAKRRARAQQTMSGIKSCLAALSPQKKTELKQLLNAKQLRVVYTNASGKVVQLTF